MAATIFRLFSITFSFQRPDVPSGQLLCERLPQGSYFTDFGGSEGDLVVASRYSLLPESCALFVSVQGQEQSVEVDAAAGRCKLRGGTLTLLINHLLPRRIWIHQATPLASTSCKPNNYFLCKFRQ